MGAALGVGGVQLSYSHTLRAGSPAWGNRVSSSVLPRLDTVPNSPYTVVGEVVRDRANSPTLVVLVPDLLLAIGSKWSGGWLQGISPSPMPLHGRGGGQWHAICPKSVQLSCYSSQWGAAPAITGPVKTVANSIRPSDFIKHSSYSRSCKLSWRGQLSTIGGLVFGQWNTSSSTSLKISKFPNKLSRSGSLMIWAFDFHFRIIWLFGDFHIWILHF